MEILIVKPQILKQPLVWCTHAVGVKEATQVKFIKTSVILCERLFDKVVSDRKYLATMVH